MPEIGILIHNGARKTKGKLKKKYFFQNIMIIFIIAIYEIQSIELAKVRIKYTITFEKTFMVLMNEQFMIPLFRSLLHHKRETPQFFAELKTWRYFRHATKMNKINSIKAPHLTLPSENYLN